MSDNARMNFWKELRRRRVYRLAGLYIVGAWLIIQVADISFPAWGVPETALRYLFIAAAACFPVALIFSWYYDITANGIVRTQAADAGETLDLSLRRADYIVLTALLTIGLAVLVGSANKIQEEIESGTTIALHAGWRENSIAVLPFTNLDIDADTGFFSDGITEEILHRLSSLRALHVLASNSSFAFRDSAESPAQISEKLGVRYLLQGSIRRENNFVRVTARLIDESGFQVWSESFERKLEGIFAIQTEIASTVASQIINKIVPISELPAGRTTENMEAYNQYLIGRAHFDARTLGWRENAVAAFEKAIELDPGFALPLAGKAMSIAINTGLGPHVDEAKVLARKALELDPELAEAHAILGLVTSFPYGDTDPVEGASMLRRALELDASLATAYNWLNFALREQGLHDEAEDALRRGLEIDPLNPPMVANVAGLERGAGNFDRAEQLLLRLINIPQPPPLAYLELYYLYSQTGRFADAIEIAKEAARLTVSDPALAISLLAWGYGDLGMTEDADYWMGLVLDTVQDHLATLDLTYNVLRTREADSKLGAELLKLVNQTEFKLGEHHPWALAQFGLVNIQLGNFGRGSEQLEDGIQLYQAGADGTGPASHIDVAALPGDQVDIVFVLHRLAFAYQQVGNIAAADGLLQALTGEFGLENDALHHALAGDRIGAMQALRATTGSDSASYYGPGKYYEIINDPAWAETIKAPNFQKLLAEMKEEVDRQRAIVEAIDAEHDFRAEVEQLLLN